MPDYADPALADPLDGNRPAFADLPAAEHTLLWSMRVWVMGHLRQQSVAERIEAALGQHGLERAQPYLDGFMYALSRGAARPIALLCLCRTEVSADERLMLDAFALLQQDEADAAQALLSRFLTESGAASAVRSAEALALEFFDGGAFLPAASAEFGRDRLASQQRVLH